MVLLLAHHERLEDRLALRVCECVGAHKVSRRPSKLVGEEFVRPGVQEGQHDRKVPTRRCPCQRGAAVQVRCVHVRAKVYKRLDLVNTALERGDGELRIAIGIFPAVNRAAPVPAQLLRDAERDA